MKKVSYQDDWTFLVEEERNRDFYATRGVELPEKREELPKLTAFLEELGVDIGKPVSHSEDKTELSFAVFGSAKASAGGYEMDFYEKNYFVSVVVLAWPDMEDKKLRTIKKNEDADILLLEVFICG